MFIDTAKTTLSDPLEADIVIVGSGPAGLTTGTALAERGHKVLILESGQHNYSEHAQALNEGQDAGGREGYLLSTRIRAFGGTSFHWGGWCAPLDPFDFEKRDWIDASGWPISRNELEPYYAKAAEICELDSASFDTKTWQRERNQAPLSIADGDMDDAYLTRYFMISPPTRFGQKYKEPVQQSKNLTVVLNTTVTQIKMNEAGTHCIGLDAVQMDGSALGIRAGRYVIACGGIENARLLLLSDDVAPRGIGNEYDLVGRYFMDHGTFNGGQIQVHDSDLDVGLYMYDSIPSVRGFGILAPSPQLMKQLRIPNFNVELMPLFEGPEGYRRRLKENYWALSWRLKKNEVFDDFGNSMNNLWSIVSNGTAYGWSSLFNSEEHLSALNLRYHIEGSPNPDSRVTLVPNDVDKNGQARARLDWRLNDIDRTGWRKAQMALATAVGAEGIGRMQLFEPDAEQDQSMYRTAWHHMGTTRMSDNPQTGVVDRNCRIHGCDNLYIAGSSVFATSGHANPTLTIVALAARLADHLAGEITND